LATLIGAKTRFGKIDFRQMFTVKNFIRKPLNLFIIIVIGQTAAAMLTIKSLAIAGIGMLSYLSPIPVLLLGFYFVRKNEDITSVMKLYIFMNAIMAAGVYLSYFGYDWDILRSVGTEMYVYPLSGGLLKLHSGFLRSSEVAAWHAGTSICMIFILFVTEKKNPLIKWISIPLTIYFLLALIFNGRRKIIMETILFLSFFGFLLLYFRRGAMKFALFTVGVGLVIAYVGSVYVIQDSDSDMYKYFERPQGIVDDSIDRFTQMTFYSFRWVIARNGFLGSGAGTGSQGAQYFGGGITRVGGSAEGGLGKILAELGVPGLAVFLWLLTAIARHLKLMLEQTRNGDLLKSQLMYGIVAFLLSNALVFIVAHQVFGDIYVLFILTLMLGFVFGMQKIPGPIE
jgi:hypothetical protein